MASAGFEPAVQEIESPGTYTLNPKDRQEEEEEEEKEEEEGEEYCHYQRTLVITDIQ
jgi:hypothetical protein